MILYQNQDKNQHSWNDHNEDGYPKNKFIAQYKVYIADRKQVDLTKGTTQKANKLI